MSKIKKILVVVLIPVLSFGMAFLGGRLSESRGVEPVSADTNIEDLQFSLREVSSSILPSVVQLDVTDVTTLKLRKNKIPFPFDFFFQEESDGDSEDESDEQESREFRRQGLGSGAIVKHENNKYYVLTNEHVVGEAEEIKVILHDKREYDAEIVGVDKRKDLALVVFETKEKNIQVATLGDSGKLSVGDFVLAVGSPMGFTSSVTFGIVSAIGRQGPAGNISDFIQTDASINQGNSGGPLVDMNGNIVGINTWIASRTGQNSGLGFAIPINNAKQAINDFINKGSVEYGWLGVAISDIPEEIGDALGYSYDEGAFVNNVYLNSPADKAGISAGTIITEVDGEAIKDSSQLVRVVASLVPGKDYKFVVFKDGKILSKVVNIAIRESEADILQKNSNLWPGINLLPISKDLAKKLNLNDNQKGL
ncbi:MAG: trypsin-like peptidase domain-containing protein, partial [Spirochaetales bacterium]|nr:trypsin-like peptidase domain-containing protein [Spirochaetales bacterium]